MHRTLAFIGFVLALIGSIILIIVGIGCALGVFLLIFAPLYAIGSFFYGIAILIIGLLAALAARWVHTMGGAIWLIIMAILASILGAVFAAWLIIMGAIIGLISRI